MCKCVGKSDSKLKKKQGTWREREEPTFIHKHERGGRREEKTGQDRIGYDRTGKERKGKDRIGQNRKGKERPGQDRTGQD